MNRSAIEDLVALFFTFLHPSENESAVFAVISAQDSSWAELRWSTWRFSF
jgi:hypothetical protein